MKTKSRLKKGEIEAVSTLVDTIVQETYSDGDPNIKYIRDACANIRQIIWEHEHGRSRRLESQV